MKIAETLKLCLAVVVVVAATAASFYKRVWGAQLYGNTRPDHALVCGSLPKNKNKN
jgi:hypothetical protein